MFAVSTKSLSSPTHPIGGVDFNLSTRGGLEGRTVRTVTSKAYSQLYQAVFGATNVADRARIIFETWKEAYNRVSNVGFTCAPDKALIPKQLHFVWLGGPLDDTYAWFQETWIQYHAHWTYNIWTNRWMTLQEHIKGYQTKSIAFDEAVLKDLEKLYGKSDENGGVKFPSFGKVMDVIILRYKNVVVQDIDHLKTFDDWYENENPRLSQEENDGAKQVYAVLKENFGTWADSLRYMVLRHYGGVYIDVDTEAFRSLDPLLCYSAFGNIFPTDDYGEQSTSMVLLDVNILGFTKDHPIMLDIVHSFAMKATVDFVVGLDRSDKKEAAIKIASQVSGPPSFTFLMTRAMREANEGKRDPLMDKVIALPTSYFYPKGHTESETTKFSSWIKPESFGVHYWWGTW